MSYTLPKIKSQFLPIILKGHERSITAVKYNSDGDLIFTCAKDKKATVWYSETGERLGTFSPHNGAIWDIDPSYDSKYLLTACADANARLFAATTGEYLAKMVHKGVVRCVKWGDGNKNFATASDAFNYEKATISLFHFDGETSLKNAPNKEEVVILQPYRIIPIDSDKAVSMDFTIGDEYLIVGFDSGMMVKYRVEDGKEIQRFQAHKGRIESIRFNRDKSLLVTASRDCSAKLIDPYEFQVLKTFTIDTPVNGAVISPKHPHILLGGGQEAQDVTTTATSQGKFETKFFHMIYGEEFGRVRGHFGPINALDIHPFGLSYVSGSEDGFIRLHHFDKNYLTANDYIPEELK